MIVEILGVNVNQIGLPEIVSWINDHLEATAQNLVATVNPEFILAAQKNKAFRQILNSAELNTVDGFGLIVAGAVLKRKKLVRVTGVDLCEKLLAGSCPQAKIYLLGGADAVAETVRIKYADARIVGAESGGKLLADKWELEDNEAVIKRINDSGANLLLVAFGQVKQEMWIDGNLSKMPNIKVAIGIGGTFDYLSGKIKRAPRWLRVIGLEWFYRLYKEPKRFQRIWNATAVFSWLMLRNLFINNS